MTEIQSVRANELSKGIIAAAIEVHRALGPGLLESAYESCMAFELAELGFEVERQKALPIIYKGVHLDCGYRIDMLVEHKVVVEIKAVQALEAIHEAQLLSYLKLSGHQLGLLINFNVKLLKHGLKRLVRELPE